LKHFPASQSADRSTYSLSVHPPSPSEVVERSSGGPVSFRVAVEDEPDHRLAAAQVSHIYIDESV
jgi:hypothetical protein